MHQSNQLLGLGTRWLRGLALGAGLLLATGTNAADVFAPGAMKVEIFNGLDGVDINTLLSADKYINNQPDEVRYVNSFITPNGIGDNYGARVSGYITPTESGDYDFFIRADDQAILFVSSDDKPANAVQVAQEIASCCEAFKEPGSGDETTASPISLTAGKRYYVYAVMKEGGGGDWFEATWRKSTDTTAAGSLKPLAGSVIGTFAPPGTVVIDQQPVAVAAIEGVRATFEVKVTTTGVVGPSIQWKKNGADIAGANSAKYTTPLLTLSDSGAKYSAKITVPGAEATTTEALLTVTADNIPPTIASVGGLKHGTDIEVGVVFNEAVDPATVVAGNFKLNSGTVSAVRHLPNSSGKDSLESGAVLSTTGLSAGTTYQLTVTGVKDVKGNAMAATTTSFTIAPFTWAALGNQPDAYPAAAIAVSSNGFNVNGGGNAFWGKEDDVTFIYEEVTGDFDKVLRVEYQDPSSQWARVGLTARDSLEALGEEAARYQNSHVNPSIMVNGNASNNSYETNRRLSKGADTTGSGGGGTPAYPHAWTRLRRAGDVMHMYRSDDNVTWYQLGYSDFNPADGSNADGPLAQKMYVGPVQGVENGNLPDDFKGLFAARFRDYGNYQPNKSRGAQTYTIGAAFGRSEANGVGSWMGPAEVAGLNQVAQGNWNNLNGQNTDEGGAVSLKAEVGTAAQNSSATIEWTCPNTWSSTGRGEENTALTGSDRQLMVGYLDTGNATTTKITLNNIPTQLTGAGYDVVVYSLGGVSGRGGGFRITDANGTELKPVVLAVSPKNPTELTVVKPTDPAVHAPGTVIVFKNLKANAIIIEGSTENGWGLSDTPRAGINAIQLVTPSGLTDQVAVNPEINIARGATGPVITYKGTLQSATSVLGPFTDVNGASSPYTTSTTEAARFFRTRQ